MTARPPLVSLIAGLWLIAVSPAAAQSLGTFRWQLSPYCNVVTLAVTQLGSQYRFEGFDDRCGATPRAAVTGLAVPNPDGTLEFGWTIVTAAGPQHVDVTFSIASLGGPWRDNGGNTGTLVFNPGTVSGSPRPGGLGAVAINPAQVQTRVSGTCGAGQYLQVVNADGSVSCGTDASGAGTITGVTPGAGLSGGGTTGAVQLDVTFAGTGTAATTARSDHFHGVGPAGQHNTAAGQTALAAVTTGQDNTAFGAFALNGSTTGVANTAIGAYALQQGTGNSNTALGYNTLSAALGSSNTAVGESALPNQSTGSDNTAVGSAALLNLTNGSSNVAVGRRALDNNVAGISNVGVGVSALSSSLGSFNIAVGTGAGQFLTNGSSNIIIGHSGLAADATTIRIGTAGTQNRAFVAGIRGVTTGNANAIPVLIDSAGQLGTVSSSRRFKDDIADLGTSSAGIFKLRPVQFRYKTPFSGGDRPIQYGLIAEEVNEVMPELVARSADGQIETVMYHVLPTLLLAEVQRLERERAEQDRRMTAQEHEIAQLRTLIDTLMKR